jgi:SAM-dependent methyltransferase
MDTDFASWHRVAAGEKADSITKLAPRGLERIIEIGCGTGAVLEALDRRGFGKYYWACEPTKELYDLISEDLGRLVSKVQATFDQAFPDEAGFDLGIITHVAEHLRTPAGLITQALTRCKYVIVEVPIEDAFIGRNRARVREVMGRPRLQNPSGHVQFFNRSTARALIHHSGGEVIDERAYFPMAPVSALAQKTYQQVVVRVASASECLGRRYYEHFAMLATAVTHDAWYGHLCVPG